MRAAGLTVLLLGLASGCSPDDESRLPDDRHWESAHFRYHTRSDDDAPCEGVLTQLERHFELMQGYLGFRWPAGRKVDYYKFRDGADYLANAGCPADSDSCARESAILSPHVLQDHELIHAYLAPLGLPPAFFTEGVAEALACDHLFAVDYPKPWQEVVAVPFSDDRRAHYEGAWFVGYLLYRHGPEAFLSLYDRLDYRAATVEGIAAAFESVYGESLDDVWTAGMELTQQVLCVNLWNCSGAELPLDGSAQELEQACDGSANSRTFELAQDADVVISSHRYFLDAPLSCSEALSHYVGGSSDLHDYGVIYEPTVVSVPAGKYFMTSAAQGGGADVGVRSLATPAFSQDCRELSALDLGADDLLWGDVGLSIPRDGNSWFVKLHPGSGRTFHTGSDSSDEVEECRSCADPPTCEPLAGDAHPDADGDVLLRLTSPEVGPGYESYRIRLTFL